jgi:hypothetical protein
MKTREGFGDEVLKQGTLPLQPLTFTNQKRNPSQHLIHSPILLISFFESDIKHLYSNNELYFNPVVWVDYLNQIAIKAEL